MRPEVWQNLEDNGVEDLAQWRQGLSQIAQLRGFSPWQLVLVAVGHHLGRPCGAAEAQSPYWAALGWASEPSGVGSNAPIARLDARPAREMYLAGFTPGQVAAVYRYAVDNQLWAPGYGSPKSPSARLVQHALVKRWTVKQLMTVHWAFGQTATRWPRDAVQVAKVWLALRSGLKRVLLQRGDDESSLTVPHHAARLAVRLGTHKGFLAVLGALVVGAVAVEGYQRERLVEAVGEQLKQPVWRLFQQFASPYAQWKALGMRVTHQARTAPPAGCSAKAVKALGLTEQAPEETYGEDLLQPVSRLLQVFGKEAGRYVQLFAAGSAARQWVHGAGQLARGMHDALAGKWLLRHIKVLQDQIRQANGAYYLVQGLVSRLVGSFQPEWDGLTWAQAVLELSKLQYQGLNPDIGIAAADAKLSVGEAEKYQEWVRNRPLPSYKTIPEVTVTGAEVGLEGDWLFQRLAPGDLRGPLLGVYTNCCQHPSGAGRACAEHGWCSPHGAFFVVSYRGSIVAQSWAWRDAAGGVCMDNIEALDGAYLEAVLKLYREAARRLLGQVWINRVTVGTSYGIPMPELEYCEPLRPMDYSGYRDSHNQQLLAELPDAPVGRMPDIEYDPDAGLDGPDDEEDDNIPF